MWCWLWFPLFLITFLKSSGVALALQIKIWFLAFFKVTVTFAGDWVFKQGRKVGIPGKSGKKTIFRSWTGIAGKWYTFFHRRLEKLDKYFCRWRLITCRSIITVVNIGFWNFWFPKMAYKQNFWCIVWILLTYGKR